MNKVKAYLWGYQITTNHSSLFAVLIQLHHSSITIKVFVVLRRIPDVENPEDNHLSCLTENPDANMFQMW